MMDFDEQLLQQAETKDEIRKMKIWMFQEQVRIQTRKDELEELSHELEEQRRTLERERNALQRKIQTENKRFQDNEVFMAKKQKIIENAFQQLAVDKKMLECERLNLEYEKNKWKKQQSAISSARNNTVIEGAVFFCGVDNQLELRKRYRELLKIFHPDNRCGDTKTLLRIQREYENMKRRYYEA